MTPRVRRGVSPRARIRSDRKGFQTGMIVMEGHRQHCSHRSLGRCPTISRSDSPPRSQLRDGRCGRTIKTIQIVWWVVSEPRSSASPSGRFEADRGEKVLGLRLNPGGSAADFRSIRRNLPLTARMYLSRSSGGSHVDRPRSHGSNDSRGRVRQLRHCETQLSFPVRIFAKHQRASPT